MMVKPQISGKSLHPALRDALLARAFVSEQEEADPDTLRAYKELKRLNDRNEQALAKPGHCPAAVVGYHCPLAHAMITAETVRDSESWCH